MAARTDLGALDARASGQECAGSLLIQASGPNQGASGDTTKERLGSLHKNTRVWEQFLHHLMLALGALHT